ncbi:unnamed protein product [Leptidea sinapis]|uniref:EF-hand domain-containing protein n=1 Tax=Leptidea sinapis TaxID=189913 RepID=A0A5E4QHY2_9NEOP|nr:unnamed protein product [Leptidea sinapis]
MQKGRGVSKNQHSGKQDYDHPHFKEIIESLKVYDGIKYIAYKIALKIFALQKELRVPPLRISSGVFARHQLSLSESSLSLDTTELESVLADIYFAAEKEGTFVGDVDVTVDLVINLLLNVYDVEESELDKWQALANCCADHNGCVSPRRLLALLLHVNALTKYLGSTRDQVQAKDSDDEIKSKVDIHYDQISAQINRLKELKDNLTNDTKPEKVDRPQAFDLFSPIPLDEKQAKLAAAVKAPPRVLSMDSGNFSVTSKHENTRPHQKTQTKQIDKTNQSISATEERYAADIRSVETSNDKMKELNSDLDTVLDRLQQILTHNFTMDESCIDNSQLRETATEMEGLLGSLIRGVEQRATLNVSKAIV